MPGVRGYNTRKGKKRAVLTPFQAPGTSADRWGRPPSAGQWGVTIMAETKRPYPSFVLYEDHGDWVHVKSWWHVTPTDNYGDDCQTGHDLAVEYLRSSLPGDHGNLQHIAAAMTDEREMAERGLRVGFWFVIDATLRAWNEYAGAESVARWLSDQRAYWADREEKEKAARSDRARKAAQARWAKARQEATA